MDGLVSRLVSGYFSFLDHTNLDTASIAFSFGTDTCLVTLDNTYVADGDRRTLDMVLEHFRIFPLLFLSIPSMSVH